MAAPDPTPLTPPPITIVVADDHRMVRSALTALLDAHDDLRVVDAVGDALAALRSVAEHRPSVLVLDLGMPGDIGSLDAIPLARRQCGVVVLTMQHDAVFVRRALQLGALGYVLKDCADTELVRAVRRAAAGERYVAASFSPGVEQRSARAVGDGLTVRERDVLRLVALGYTNAEIAERLVLSVRTVESHRAHIQRKLRRRRRADLVRYALDHGLLTT